MNPVWKGEAMITSMNYVQPISSHCQHPERLLLRNGLGEWFIWFGDGREMETIPVPMAEWMISRPEMHLLQMPMLWFDPSTLPVSATTI